MASAATCFTGKETEAGHTGKGNGTRGLTDSEVRRTGSTVGTWKRVSKWGCRGTVV